MKPQFVFIGPTKSGTTWIDAYLRARNDVALPVHQKETFFFDKLYERGLGWYERQFPRDGAGGVCVEVAPSLLGKPEAARRLARDLPGVQVVCTLRHPVDRTVSHYFHYLKTGEKDVGLARMYSAYPDVMTAGLYHQHLQVWVDLLGRQNVHVMLYDEMRSAPDAFCRELCSILGIAYIPPSKELVEARINEAGIPRHRWLARLMRSGSNWARRDGLHWLVNIVRSTGLREASFGGTPDNARKAQVKEEAMQFAQLFEQDIQGLEGFLGRDLGAWKRQLRSRSQPAEPGPAGISSAAVVGKPS